MENRPIVPEPSATPPSLVETVGDEPRTNVVGALIGGFIASVIAAALCGVLVALMGWQVGYFAIGVGIIVGIGVRTGGRGVNFLHGIIAALFALGGTILGNIFAIASEVSRIRGVSFLEMFSPSEFSFVMNVFSRSFEPIDLIFYDLPFILPLVPPVVRKCKAFVHNIKKGGVSHSTLFCHDANS